jgi:hypothetical protein
MSGDEILEHCSDAVLVLKDGSTVPCSRYVIMAKCTVLRVMMEIRSDADANGKHRIPVMDHGLAKYSNFGAIAHGLKSTESMSFDELIDVLDAARRLGAEDVERAALRSAWDKARDIDHALTIVPDLFRLCDKACTAEIVAAMASKYPLWADVQRTVLASMAHLANESPIAHALLTLQFHYPPSIVAMWLMRHARDPTEELLLKILTTNPHLYCPLETLPIHEKAIDMYAERPEWNRGSLSLLRSFALSSGTSSQIPPSAHGMCGFQVEFEDLPRTIVSIALCANRSHRVKPVQLGQFVRLRMPKKDRAFGFDVCMTSASRPFQVRVTMSRDVSLLDPFFEAWYEFDVVVPGTWLEAGEPTISHGSHAELEDSNRTAYARFEIRHGKRNAITDPLSE